MDLDQGGSCGKKQLSATIALGTIWGGTPKVWRRRLVPQIQGGKLSEKYGKDLVKKHNPYPQFCESLFLPGLLFLALWLGKCLTVKLR